MTRIPAVDPKTATGKAEELLAGVQAKLGMTPNLMATMANSPAVLDAYLKFSGALSDGVLSAMAREQIALAVSQSNGCDYCLSAHSAIGKTVGLSPEQIRDARRGVAVDRKSDAVLKLATQIVDKRGFVTDEDLDQAKSAGVTDAEVTEVVANTALNLFTNYFNHVAETVVDFPAAEKLDTKELHTAAAMSGCSTETCGCPE